MASSHSVIEYVHWGNTFWLMKCFIKTEQVHNTSYKIACVPSEDSH